MRFTDRSNDDAWSSGDLQFRRAAASGPRRWPARHGDVRNRM